MVFGPTFLCLHCLKCQSASRGHNLPYQLPMATGAKTCMAFGHIFSSWILHLGKECNQLEALLTLMGFAPTELTLPKFKDLRVRLLELLAILLHSCDQVMDHPNIRDPPRHPNKVTRHLWHLEVGISSLPHREVGHELGSVAQHGRVAQEHGAHIPGSATCFEQIMDFSTESHGNFFENIWSSDQDTASPRAV